MLCCQQRELVHYSCWVESRFSRLITSGKIWWSALIPTANHWAPFYPNVQTVTTNVSLKPIRSSSSFYLSHYKFVTANNERRLTTATWRCWGLNPVFLISNPEPYPFSQSLITTVPNNQSQIGVVSQWPINNHNCFFPSYFTFSIAIFISNNNSKLLNL